MLAKLLKLEKKYLIIVFKLLHDLLFIVLIFFLLALLAEGALPSIITAHIGFSKVIALIFINLFVIYILGDYLNIEQKSSGNKKTAFFLLLILALLIFNSLLKLNIFLNIFILLAVLATGYFVYKAFLEE